MYFNTTRLPAQQTNTSHIPVRHCAVVHSELPLATRKPRFSLSSKPYYRDEDDEEQPPRGSHRSDLPIDSVWSVYSSELSRLGGLDGAESFKQINRLAGI